MYFLLLILFFLSFSTPSQAKCAWTPTLHCVELTFVSGENVKPRFYSGSESCVGTFTYAEGERKVMLEGKKCPKPNEKVVASTFRAMCQDTGKIIDASMSATFEDEHDCKLTYEQQFEKTKKLVAEVQVGRPVSQYYLGEKLQTGNIEGTENRFYLYYRHPNIHVKVISENKRGNFQLGERGRVSGYVDVVARTPEITNGSQFGFSPDYSFRKLQAEAKLDVKTAPKVEPPKVYEPCMPSLQKEYQSIASAILIKFQEWIADVEKLQIDKTKGEEVSARAEKTLKEIASLREILTRFSKKYANVYCNATIKGPDQKLSEVKLDVNTTLSKMIQQVNIVFEQMDIYAIEQLPLQ